MKETVMWRVWGGAVPVRSLVRENDHSYTVASWYPSEKQGGIYVPKTRKRMTFKTYNAWLKSVARHFTIVNKTISW